MEPNTLVENANPNRASPGAALGGKTPADKIEETTSTISDLVNLLRLEDEAPTIWELREQKKNIDALNEAKLLGTKDIIRQLTAKVDALEGQIEPPPSEEEQARELAALKANQETITENIATLEGQIGDHSAALAELKAAQLGVEKELARAKAQHAASMPRVAHSISLYATISGIRWDYSRENLVAGVVSTQREVREFEFDPESASRFDITQSLWDMIDPRH